jgi:Leucine-rich repeat (LRR) protein
MLWLNDTPVSDISPLKNCPLVSLTLHRTQVIDLSPLAGTSLERLHIGETPVSDLTPITGLVLSRLIFSPGQIRKGLDEVRNMITFRELGTTFENRMPPNSFWQLLDDGNLE